MTQPTVPAPDFVSDAQARFDALANYEVTLRSTSASAEAIVVRYGYRKPGFVRMDFIRPHAGATLVYSPETRQVTLWPFGFGTFPRLTLSPGSRLIQSPHGHRVDESDIGALLLDVRKLQGEGSTRVLGPEAIGTSRTAHVVVERGVGHEAAGVCRYELWFDASHGLPVKVVSEGASGRPIETVLMEDLNIDVPAWRLAPFG
ncbi:MAG TPA: DUF1571 domain-containing protein [Trinickia sp.]|nr:DUF1571 domain-containing protein [Trinickia sp.]